MGDLPPYITIALKVQQIMAWQMQQHSSFYTEYRKSRPKKHITDLHSEELWCPNHCTTAFPIVLVSCILLENRQPVASSGNCNIISLRQTLTRIFVITQSFLVCISQIRTILSNVKKIVPLFILVMYIKQGAPLSN